METITLQAEARTGRGTRDAKRVRAEGMLPAIIYGHGEPPEAITVAHHDVEAGLAHGARTFEVQLGGKSSRYLIKEVQYDHLGDTIIHLDLARVDMNERVTVSVGIETRGVPKGISDGGVLEHYLAEIDVECLVVDIPETLHPMVTHLGVGETLFVKDLQLPPGITAVTGGDERICSVRMLVEKPEATTVVEGEVAVAEPERIGRIKKEEEEGEEKKEKK